MLCIEIFQIETLCASFGNIEHVHPKQKMFH